MIWLIGAGPMAIDYAKVLKDQKREFIVIGRGTKSAEVFSEKIEIPVQIGGLKKWLSLKPELPKSAIIAVNIKQLAETTTQLLDYGVQRILLEKPGGFSVEEIYQLYQKVEAIEAEVYIAYNRRFYASTFKAQEIIKADGGVTSFDFEFTEWSHVVQKTKHSSEVKRGWFLVNSTHVIDLAFYLGGTPQELSSYTAGSLDWHSPAIFSGAGISKNDALFSYQANWAAPGRWGVEVLTRKHRLYFRPMEQLHVQNIGSVAVEMIEIDDQLEQHFKPGLYQQTAAFIESNQNKTRLCSLKQHSEALMWYTKIVQPSSNITSN